MNARENVVRAVNPPAPDAKVANRIRTPVRAVGRNATVDPEGPLWRIMEGIFFSVNELRRPAEAALEQFQLGLAHHRAMTFIYKFPGITSGELRRILEVSNQAQAKVLGSLVKRGLVEQVTDTEDRRVRHLHLTDIGRTIYESAVKQQLAIVERAARAAGKEAVCGFLALTDHIALSENAKAIAKPVSEEALAKLFGDRKG